MRIENIGRKLLNKKNFCFFSIISFFPILISICFLGIKLKKIESLEEEIENIYKEAKNSYFLRKVKNNFFKKYLRFDPYFIDKNIENISFMKTDINIIKRLLNHPAFIISQKLKNRLSFLEEGQNKLFFEEKKINYCLNFKESIVQQKKEVEVEKRDIKKLLSIIEDVSIGEYNPVDLSPFFQIQRITLTKKSKNSFILNNLSLIKREFYEN